MTGAHRPTGPGAGPLVSVVIPTHNCAAYIVHAIESVLAQTVQDLEIIVVDDGSTDTTAARLKRFGKAIDYLAQDRRGAAVARNAGIAQARGRYVAFLDADDLWEPDKLALQVSLAEAHPGVGLVFSDCCWFNERGIIYRSWITQRDRFPQGQRLPAGGTWVGRTLPDLLLQNFLHTSTVLIPRGCLNEVGAFDESYLTGEDHHLWVRIAARFDLGYVHKPLVRVRLRPESLINHDFRPMYRNEIRVVKECLPILGRPDLATRIRLRRRLAELHFRFGWRLFKVGEGAVARREFAASLRRWPLQVLSAAYWGLALLPHRQVAALRSLRRRLAGG